jgi:hypothetical protein
MNIQASKIELVKLILDTNNQVLIEKVLSLFDSEAKNATEFTPAQIEEIELGLKQIEKGQGIKFKEYMKKVS